jgi:hypothetical protein
MAHPRLRAIADVVRAMSPLDAASCATLLLIALTGPRYWYAAVPLTMLALAGLLVKPIRDARSYWLVVATILFTANYLNWYEVDNHKHLLAYWCLGLWLIRHSEQPDRAVALTGRWLIGLAFLFATYWKLAMPDFLSGEFFHFEYLFDTRFKSVALLLGGLSDETYLHNRQLLRQLLDPASAVTAAQISSAEVLALAGKAMAGWTVLIEGGIAIAFLAPLRSSIGWVRDLALLGFVCTTYLLAPVLGFAYLLLAMGLAQVGADRLGTRCAYLGVFCALSVVNAPWLELVRAVFLDA